MYLIIMEMGIENDGNLTECSMGMFKVVIV